jgi:hypothetical protein
MIAPSFARLDKGFPGARLIPLHENEVLFKRCKDEWRLDSDFILAFAS